MIRLSGIAKSYDLDGQLVVALDGVDLSVERNEYLAITGPSGSGKSTLMNIVGCLDFPTVGSYFLNGRAVSSSDDDQLAFVRNREIGFVFQNFYLLPRMTVIENVMQPLVYRGMVRRERFEMAKAALEKVGLGDRLLHRPNQLSGGQRQRTAIARALVGNPSIILADEPTGNLDSKSSTEIMSLLDNLHHLGHTIIVITHDSAVASHCAREVRVLDGKIIYDRNRDGLP